MLHACFLSNAYMFPSCFHMFSFVFRMFSYTNILTRCLRPVAVFCMFLISEILLRKYSRNGLKSTEISFYLERRQRPKETRRGARVHIEGHQARPHPRPRLMGALATASRRLFAYLIPLTLKSSATELFSMKTTQRCRHQIGRAHV